MQESMRILLVDDTLENVRLLNDILAPAGYQISFATSGEQALAMVKVDTYDLILLDVMMPPGIDGFETCRRLKAETQSQDIPIFFVTARNDSDSLKKGFACGAVDYIHKPVNADEVLLRVASQMRIRSLIQQLQVANQTKDRFFSIIAHDLRSPLSSIMQLSEFTLEQEEPSQLEDMEKVLRVLHQSARQTFKLLENLLQWSRAQTGTIAFHPETMSVHALLDTVVGAIKMQAVEKNIQLSCSAPELNLHIDVNMMGTVLRNLLSNAIKFCRAGDTIDITVTSQHDTAWFSVRDTGIGIPANKLDSLFVMDKKFVRNGTAGEPGSGLGLLLVKEFIEYHQGRLEVSSEVDQGTTFRFSLPLQNES